MGGRREPWQRRALRQCPPDGCTVMFSRGCCGGGDSEMGPGMEGLGRVFKVSVWCMTTLWRQTGADLALVWGHPLCSWILPDCR